MKSFKQFLNKNTLSPEELAKKHDVSLQYIKKQLKIGTKIEGEHTNIASVAKEIASDHLGEKPDYYQKIKKYGL